MSGLDPDGSTSRAPSRLRLRVSLGTRLFFSLAVFLAAVMTLVVALVERRMAALTQTPPLPVAELHVRIGDTRVLLLSVFGGAIVVGGMASYLMARRITDPIRHLVTGANLAAQGRLDTRLDVRTGDELEELARSFNHMVAQIQANQQVVADMNQVLEEKVRARTEDLSRSNDELRAAYAELTQIEAQVLAAEKMASLGQLVAGICHEINTPNSAICAAVVNIGEYLDMMNRQIRMIMNEGVPPVLEERFFQLIDHILRSDPAKRQTGTAEIRQHARLLEAKMTRQGVRNARELALTFTRLGFGDEALEVIEAARDVPGVSSLLCLRFLENMGHLAVAVQDIRLSTETITRMVKALRSYVRAEKARKGYSHLDQADMAETDIHEGIENALTLLRNQIRYGVVIERRYGKLPSIVCSGDELNQVWTNIIHNALQAMKSMGKITIETYKRPHGVAVRITDNGPGISREHLGRIFDPFFTTKGQGVGSGLGLSISQQIVERHQGEIRVDSEPGKTSFEVLLPFQPTLIAEHA